MSNRQKVITFFTSDRNFENGRRLYISIPGHNLAYARALSAQHFSEVNFEVLCYELGKLAELNERQVKAYLSKPLEAAKTEAPSLDISLSGEGAEARGGRGIKETVLAMDYHQELKPKVSELNLEVPDQKKATLQEALISYLEKQKDDIEAISLSGEGAQRAGEETLNNLRELSAEELKQKFIEFNIDPADRTTEEEGLKLLAEAILTQKKSLQSEPAPKND